MIRTPALLVTAALLCVACGSDIITDPTPTSFAGTWNGTVTDSLSGIHGSLNGTVSGAVLQATLQSSDPQYCSLGLSVATSGSTITGTYAAVNCSYTQTGSVSATRQ